MRRTANTELGLHQHGAAKAVAKTKHSRTHRRQGPTAIWPGPGLRDLSGCSTGTLVIDGQRCRVYGGNARVITAIEDKAVIDKILTHLDIKACCAQTATLPQVCTASARLVHLVRIERSTLYVELLANPISAPRSRLAIRQLPCTTVEPQSSIMLSPHQWN